MTNAANPSAPSKLTQRLAEMRFFTFSLLLHSILVIVLGTVVLYQSEPDAPQFIAGGSNGLIADTSLLEPPPETKVEESPKDSLQSSASAPVASNLQLDAITSSSNANSFTVSPTGIKPTLDGLASGAGGDAIKGIGLGGPGAGMGGNSMRFFGTRASGQQIVIVVDVSGSMVQGKGKSGKTYEELEKEVIRVIREMDLKSSFGLVVFSREAKPYRTHMVRSTNEEKERAIAWLKKHNPVVYIDPNADAEEKAFHRGTRADLGLAEAFKLAPDLIFFVSDGEPTGAKPAEILTAVEEAQKTLRRTAPIHSVAYLADSGQKFMKSLAEKNAGTFREVNPQDIK
jgi:hypothetical protein